MSHKPPREPLKELRVDLPPDVHRALKVRAAQQGITLRDFLIRLFIKEMSDGKSK